jgi:hypothetical protein
VSAADPASPVGGKMSTGQAGPIELGEQTLVKTRNH